MRDKFLLGVILLLMGAEQCEYLDNMKSLLAKYNIISIYFSFTSQAHKYVSMAVLFETRSYLHIFSLITR